MTHTHSHAAHSHSSPTHTTVYKEVKRLRQFTEEHATTLSRQNLRFQTYDPSMFLAGRTIIEELSHVCEKFNTGMTKIIKGREAMLQLLLEK
ncbi:hypothetical protein SARC_15556, partial [Sphaeroforma arctica JP610]